MNRYVKTVPLAAQMLDVRRNQKLEMVKELKMEKVRLQEQLIHKKISDSITYLDGISNFLHRLQNVQN